MRTEHTRRGQTQETNDVIKNKSHSRGMLSGIFNACRCKTEENSLLNGCVEDPQLRPLGMTPNFMTTRGFTLIEILVVVLIIGILGAIALPQYQRAVLKSRYAAMMPIAKAMADSNEVFYLEHGNYTDDPQAFPVQGRRDYADGTHLDFGTSSEYAYVLAKNEDKIPNNTYVVYQKHSTNYPGEIHCEALADNDLAEGVCKSFGATRHIGPTITATHNTWLLEGSRGNGIEPEALEDEQDDETGQDVISCNKAEVMGYTCNMSTNEQGEPVKQVCTTIGSGNFCRTKTYNEDGSYTSITCQVNSEGVCTSNLKTATYDANGNKLVERTCRNIDSNGNCTEYSSGLNYTYDANGNKLTQRYCSSVDGNGNCTAYSYVRNYTYDANGNMLTQRYCSSVNSSGNCTAYSSGTDYTYDANGNILTQRACSSFDSNGNCTAYGAGSNYTYDTNGNKLTEAHCASSSNNGNCTRYDYLYGYTYDANGNILIRQFCREHKIVSQGTACSQYYTATNYTYDHNGNMLTERDCNSIDSKGNCTAYNNSGSNRNYTYDDNGNILTNRWCSSVDSNGNCTAYSSGSNYTYDANGNQLTSRSCSSIDSNGNCTAYSGGNDYTYDDNGKQIASQYCSGDNINASTGECIAYNSTTVQSN